MALEWDYSGIGYPDTCISIEDFSYSNIIIDAGRKAKKNLPSLNWLHLLGSSVLNFAEQAVWQSCSRDAHSEGELQADLKHWSLVFLIRLEKMVQKSTEAVTASAQTPSP